MKLPFVGYTAIAATFTTAALVDVQQQSGGNSSNPLITRNPPEQVDISLNLTSGPYDNDFYRSNLTTARQLDQGYAEPFPCCSSCG